MGEAAGGAARLDGQQQQQQQQHWEQQHLVRRRRRRRGYGEWREPHPSVPAARAAPHLNVSILSAVAASDAATFYLLS